MSNYFCPVFLFSAGLRPAEAKLKGFQKLNPDNRAVMLTCCFTISCTHFRLCSCSEELSPTLSHSLPLSPSIHCVWTLWLMLCPGDEWATVDKVHSNNLQTKWSCSDTGQKFIIQLSESFIRTIFSCGFWFIFRFRKVSPSWHSTGVTSVNGSPHEKNKTPDIRTHTQRKQCCISVHLLDAVPFWKIC